MTAHRFAGLLIAFSAILSATAPGTGSWEYWLEEPELHTDTSSYGYRSCGAYSDGDLKRAFDPSVRRSLSGTTWGRTVTSGGLEVNGAFRYSQRSEDGLSFIHDRDPYGPIPILLADSSVTGNRLQRFDLFTGLKKNFNGIETNLEVRYAVDDGWHTVFPKSESRHVDRMISASVHFPVGDKNRFGVTLSEFNFQEILTTSPYQLDQDLTPVFLRISGLDYPVILRGSGSIERLKIHEGMSWSLEFSGRIGRFSLFRESGSGSAQDGGAYLEPMGTWNSDRTGADIEIRPRSSLLFKLQYSLTGLDAFHPELDLDIFRYEQRFLTGGFTWTIRPRQVLNFSFASHSELSDDLFTGSRRYFQFLESSFNLRTELLQKKNHRIGLMAGAGHREPIETVFQTVDNAGWYYNDCIASDLNYYSDPVNSFTLGPEWTVAGTAHSYSMQCSYSELRTAGSETMNRSVTLTLSVSRSN